MSSFRWILIVLASATLACTDPLRPAELDGFHLLLAADGTPSGSILWSTEGCDMLLSGGSMSLDGTRFTLNLLGRLDCTRASGPTDWVDVRYNGDYDSSAHRLTFSSWNWPLNVPLDSVEFTGRVAGDTLVVMLPPGATGALGLQTCLFALSL